VNQPFKIAAIAIVSISVLAGCAAQDSTPPPNTTAPTVTRDASKLFVKDTQVCFYNRLPEPAVQLTFGSSMYPNDYYVNANMSSPAGNGGPVAAVRSMGWVCTDTRNDERTDMPGSIDVITTVTFPNGRKTTFGFANPALEAPIFYPSNESNNQGPGAGQQYKIPEGSTYTCSMLGYDFTVLRRADDSSYKYWAVEFIGQAAITDDFDSQLCKP
jgi:hypothetical protein